MVGEEAKPLNTYVGFGKAYEIEGYNQRIAEEKAKRDELINNLNK